MRSPHSSNNPVAYELPSLKYESIKISADNPCHEK